MHFLTKFLICCFISYYAQAEVAGSDKTYTTSLGYTFTQVQGPGGFGSAWRAPNGVLWGSYRGDFSNSIVHGNDTEAIGVCKKVGGQLPSSSSFKKLTSFFERAQFGPFFSEQGLKDWTAVFPDMRHRDFWTATSSSTNPELAMGFDADRRFFGPVDRSKTLAVRCVLNEPDLLPPGNIDEGVKLCKFIDKLLGLNDSSVYCALIAGEGKISKEEADFCKRLIPSKKMTAMDCLLGITNETSVNLLERCEKLPTGKEILACLKED